jgi:hypothetical protein
MIQLSKPVPLPIHGIVFYIIPYPFKRSAIANDMIVKTGLPFKICADFPDFKRTTPFVPPDDPRNIFLDHRIFPPRNSSPRRRRTAAIHRGSILLTTAQTIRTDAIHRVSIIPAITRNPI